MDTHKTDGGRSGRYGGYTSLTPHIIVSPASEALDFYQRVYRAEVLSLTNITGRVLHALLDFGQGKLTLSDPSGDRGPAALASNGKSGYSLAIYVTDVDHVIREALEAGAELLDPIENFVSGDRSGSIIDPFGVQWSVLTRLEDLFSA